MFIVLNDYIMAKPLWGSAVVLETEAEGCVDALVEETARSLGDWAAGRVYLTRVCSYLTFNMCKKSMQTIYYPISTCPVH
jgi:adenylosuccinate lyase